MSSGNQLDQLIEAIRHGTLVGALPVEYQDLDLNATDVHGLTPLMVAALSGNEDAVVTLIRAGAHANALGRLASTALHDAAASGEEEIARLLLAAGATVDALSSDGTTPLMLATRWGHFGMIKLLLGHGADRHRMTHRGETAADLARLKGEDDAADYLESL